MIDYLTNIDKQLSIRYNTLIKNIKVKSNSFYDSYLDLLESTIKFVLNEYEIYYDNTKTCGVILKTNIVSEFLLNILCLEQRIIDKFHDYIKKCNDHKHKKEKYVTLETVINFMDIYKEFISQIYLIKYDKDIKLDSLDYKDLFGQTERENNELKVKLENLKLQLVNLSNDTSCIEKYSISKLELLSLEQQNNEIISYILQIEKSISNLSSKVDIINKKIDDFKDESIAIGTEINDKLDNITNVLETNNKDKIKEKVILQKKLESKRTAPFNFIKHLSDKYNINAFDIITKGEVYRHASDTKEIDKLKNNLIMKTLGDLLFIISMFYITLADSSDSINSTETLTGVAVICIIPLILILKKRKKYVALKQTTKFNSNILSEKYSFFTTSLGDIRYNKIEENKSNRFYIIKKVFYIVALIYSVIMVILCIASITFNPFSLDTFEHILILLVHIAFNYFNFCAHKADEAILTLDVDYDHVHFVLNDDVLSVNLITKNWEYFKKGNKEETKKEIE